MSKHAFITGISGQDGQHLANLLLNKGYSVTGISRHTNKQVPGATIYKWNYQHDDSLAKLLSEKQPDEFYNFAGYTTGIGLFDKPVDIGEINGVLVTRILEMIRQNSPHTRFCQASSREVFGNLPSSPQSEQSPRWPNNPYGAAKQYADTMVQIYRQHYGLFACSAILFNHESPLRSTDFVTRKITHAVAKIRAGLQDTLQLGNLDSYRDWGFAGDYVYGMWLMLQAPKSDDFVLATGESHSVREFCELAFTHAGLDYRKHVIEDIALARKKEHTLIKGDYQKSQQLLGWEPSVSFQELVAMMVNADLAQHAHYK